MCQFCGQVNSAMGGCGHCWVIPQNVFELDDATDFSSVIAALSANLAKKPKCECGNPKSPIGHGHSDWCDLYKKEF